MALLRTLIAFMPLLSSRISDVRATNGLEEVLNEFSKLKYFNRSLDAANLAFSLINLDKFSLTNILERFHKKNFCY